MDENIKKNIARLESSVRGITYAQMSLEAKITMFRAALVTKNAKLIEQAAEEAKAAFEYMLDQSASAVALNEDVKAQTGWKD